MENYKKSEKKAFKEAEKYQKKKKKEQDKKNKLKIKKDKNKNKSTSSSTSGTGTGVRSKFIKYKGKMLRRGTPMAKKAEAAEAARKRLGAKGYMR